MDQRKQALDLWVSAYCQAPLSGVSASSDASFRRYFRYQHQGQTYIAMDAPPPQEDCRPFVQIARLMAAAGIRVPEILCEDIEQGFLLLSDLGSQTLLEVIKPDNAGSYFSDAIGTLLQIQQLPVAGLAVYDEAMLRRELELFPEWYLQRECGVDIGADLRRRLDHVFAILIDSILTQPRVFVHRDYMPRNLMAGSRLGVLDFQDAVAGPISYDVASLFKDAFISWPEAKVRQWQGEYWQQAQRAGLPVASRFDDFVRDCDWIGMQRHLKVIGIFARINHRDGKPRYLADVPRFFDYLIPVVARYPELADLGRLLAEYRVEVP